MICAGLVGTLQPVLGMHGQRCASFSYSEASRACVPVARVSVPSNNLRSRILILFFLWIHGA